ncbi:MAG: prepilin peptidase [Armatimonadota bacterium]|nr:prepilin peptidase [Armatimonadota bacterium]MDR7519434.1 prepilin peptidase [Armatimonadota bacterium]MDR7549872.1 prepilin peptidase [Armatimonadota bacterium]
MSAVTLLVMAAFGAVVGSFANVVIHRVPRRQSVVVPGSRCPRCGAPIRAADNIPLISFVLLRGRCRTCGGKISPRYPVVEALMAALAVAVYLRFPQPLGLSPFPWTLVSGWTFAFLLLAITFIDLDHQIIPHRLTWPGIGLGLVLAAGQGRVVAALLAGLAGAALILAIILASVLIMKQEGMGLGDAWLAALMGVYLGWPQVGVALLLAIYLGGLAGLVLWALRIRGRRDPIPFGPALAAGGLLTLFWGQAVVDSFLWFWR